MVENSKWRCWVGISGVNPRKKGSPEGEGPSDRNVGRTVVSSRETSYTPAALKHHHPLGGPCALEQLFHVVALRHLQRRLPCAAAGRAQGR